MRQKEIIRKFGPLKIVLIYAVFSALYIFFSDRLLMAVTDNVHLITRIQMIKGWIFILVTSLIIFFLLKREIRKYIKLSMSLSESEKKYRHLVENAGDAIIVLQEGKIRFVNTRLIQFTGLNADDLLGKEFKLFVHPEDIDCPFIHSLEKETAYNEDCCLSFRLINKQNQTIHVEANSVSIDWENNPSLLIFIRNITEKLALEKRLSQVQKAEVVGTLAGGIAHDFNNILHPLIGYSEVLEEELPEDSRHREYASEMLKAAIRGAGLVRQILDFSKEREEPLSLLDLKPEIMESISLLETTFPSSIRIEHQFCDEPCFILAEPDKIHQIIMNLGTNAFHAMEKTGGVLKITLGIKSITKEDKTDFNIPDGNYVRLIISDTGEGIPENIRERIFNPYFTTKSIDKGSGLGLSIVQGIVRNYKGAITMNSKTGKGTEFIIYLPLQKEPVRIENKPGNPG